MKQLAVTFVIFLPTYFASLFAIGGETLRWRLTPMGQVVTLSIVALGLLGVAYFIVDAFRREYYADRTLPIALAITGLLSLGVTTIIYFMIWGWQDRHATYASDFCDKCASESSEFVSGLDLTTLNFVNAGRLVGAAKRCSECNSVIQTHCFYICGVPIFSCGSFRVQCPSMGHYLLRKCRLYRPHLLQIFLMPVVLIAFHLAIFVWGD